MFTVIEGFIISGIIILQFIIAYRLWLKIREYCDIYNIESLPSIKTKYILKLYFDNVDSGNILSTLENGIEKLGEGISEKSYVKIIFLEDRNESKTLSTIVKYINVYLLKNKGASIDFHIIKDIVDKHTETIETQIDNRVPAPLYLGLAATMLGIIIGLFTVNFSSGIVGTQAVQPLIDGVKWAMSASVIGLLITTVFSIKIYKDAQVEVDEEKNEFLSKLQSELMPKMSIGKLPEVSMLSDKLDSFARTTIDAVSQLDKIVQTSSYTISQEQLLLTEIRAMDVKMVASANVLVFSKLEEMMGSFDNFAKYYNELDKSMVSTSDLLNNLKQFVSNSQNVNTILEEIKSNIKQSNVATEFFNKHIQSFVQYNESVNEAVTKNDSTFRTAIEQLTMATTAQMDSFNILISNYDTKLSTAFTLSVNKFAETMDEQVRRTEQAFIDGRPKFEKLNELDKLVKLEVIEGCLKNLEDQILIGNKSIVQELKGINSSINSQMRLADSNLNENSLNPQRYVQTVFERNFSIITTILKIGMYFTVSVYGIVSVLKYFNIIL